MSKTHWVLLFVLGCKNAEEPKNTESVDRAPESCVVDDEVCISFTSDWSSGESTEVCDEYEGVSGECPGDELGACTLESGLNYHIYGMNSVDAAAYCAYFGGDWVLAGSEESG